MDEFFADVAAAMNRAGVPGGARRTISEVETPLTRPEKFALRLAEFKGRYREIFELAVGHRVDRLLIAPVPSYIIPALPDLIAEFAEVVLADTFKAGSTIAGLTCVSLDDPIAVAERFDACFLGTVDLRLGQMFRNLLPPERTIGAAELVWFDPVGRARGVAPGLEDFHRRIQAAKRPLIVLTAYLDATVGPTLIALQQRGIDVFIVTRQVFNPADSANAGDPAAIGVDRLYVAEFDEMLWLLARTEGCPVLVNYVRFFASHWDLRYTVPLFAYTLAVMTAIAGPRLLHLYDAFQVSIDGLEAERSSFGLYRDLLDLADGIVVNADVEPVLRDFLGRDKPIISLLRYGPDAEVQPEPDSEPFSIAMITGFLGEANDPTRTTAGLVRGLLRDGFHVHYYSSGPVARGFRDALPEDEAGRFHLHDPIRDQRQLVHEISRYHAGWFVADMTCCETLDRRFETAFAQSLAGCFVATTVATAGILYGCAGLPTIFNAGHYTAKLFPPGTVIEIDPTRVTSVKSVIEARDWPAMRRAVMAERTSFTMSVHIGRMVSWLGQFYPSH